MTSDTTFCHDMLTLIIVYMLPYRIITAKWQKTLLMRKQMKVVELKKMSAHYLRYKLKETLSLDKKGKNTIFPKLHCE